MTDPAGSSAAVAAPSRIEALSRTIAEAYPGLTALHDRTGELTCEVPAERLLEIAAAFRDRPALKFEMCMDVCGLDHLDYGRAEWKTEAATTSGFSRGVARGNTHLQDLGAPPASTPPPAVPGRRFAVVYHLLSITHNHRVRLKVFCADDAQPMVDSVTGIWAGTDWFEREAFDLFGILFKGHPDLRRLLTDYGFIGHPFRKDFPLAGNVEVRYDPEKGRVIYQPVTIESRTLVPKVIRHDNRYDPALTNAPVAAPAGEPGTSNG